MDRQRLLGLIIAAQLISLAAVGRADDEFGRVPIVANPPLPEGVIRTFGAARFRSSVYSSNTRPFFSPSGKLIITPAARGLTAFDTTTGRVRFQYRCRKPDATVHDRGPDGIHVSFRFGANKGTVVVIDHETGHELRRGPPQLIAGRAVWKVLKSADRAIVSGERTRIIDGKAVPGRTTRIRALISLPESQQLTELSRALVVSPDESRIALLTGYELFVVATKSGAIEQSLPLGESMFGDWITEPCFRADSSAVFVWRHRNQMAELVELDCRTGQVRIIHCEPRRLAFGSPSVSPDGRFLAFRKDAFPDAEYDWQEVPIIRVLRLDDLSVLYDIDARPVADRGVFSPDSQSFWLQCVAGPVRFDLTDGQFDPLTPSPAGVPRKVVFSQDGQRLFVIAGIEMTTWDVIKGRECADRIQFDTAFRESDSLSCDFLGRDGCQSLWRLNGENHRILVGNDGHEAARLVIGKSYHGDRCVLSSNGQRYVFARPDGGIEVGNLLTGDKVRHGSPTVDASQECRIALAPNNKTLALLRFPRRAFDFETIEKASREIEIWDTERGVRLSRIRGTFDSLRRMQFSQNGRELRIWTMDNECSTWDVKTRELAREPRDGFGHDELGNHPNRHWTLRGVDVTTEVIGLFDIDTNTLVREWNSLTRFTTPSAVAIAPDLKTFASIDRTGRIHICDLYGLRSEFEALLQQSDAELIEALGNSDVRYAFNALCTLISRGDACVPAIQRHLESLTGRGDLIRRLVGELNSSDFQLRERATTQLQSVIPLSDVYEYVDPKSLSLEQRKRLNEVVRHLKSSASINRLRAYRCVETLEVIGTPTTRSLITRLANDESGGIIAAEAAASLNRIHNSVVAESP